MRPFQTQLETVTQQLTRMQQDREQAVERDRQVQQQNQYRASQMMAAHQDLASRYPDRVDIPPRRAGPVLGSRRSLCWRSWIR